MKKFFIKVGPVLATLALFITTFNVNTTCALYAYQPKLPDVAKKLSKTER
jgi:AgrD protein